MYASAFVSLCLFVCLLCLCVPVSLPVCLSVLSWLSVYLSCLGCLSVCLALSVFMSCLVLSCLVCMSVCLSHPNYRLRLDKRDRINNLSLRQSSFSISLRQIAEDAVVAYRLPTTPMSSECSESLSIIVNKEFHA